MDGCFYSDEDYQRLARQCVRAALVLLTDAHHLALSEAELASVLRWPGAPTSNWALPARDTGSGDADGSSASELAARRSARA